MHSSPLSLTAALAACVTLLPTVVAAQFPPGRPGGRMGGGQRPGIGALDPVVVEGPPAPAELGEIAQLDSAQAQRYDSLYGNFMAQTQSDRDSVKAARERMREAFADRDRGAVRRESDAMRSRTRRLEAAQKAFDGILKDLLTKDQWKRYEDWRDDLRRNAERERREAGGRPPQ